MTTNNKLSFAALTDRLFIAQGDKVYSASLRASKTDLYRDFFLNAVNLSRGTMKTLIEPAPAPALAPAPAADGQIVDAFTGVASISVLKTTDKFYLAVGDPADTNDKGKVVVYEGPDSAFSSIKKKFTKFGDNEGDWFGWSVKLGILDRDGAGTGNPAEAVLFVGAPKAPNSAGTSGVGYVKVFDIGGGDIQTITPAGGLTGPVIKAFGYSIAATGDHLAIGAPQSDSGKGAIYFYKWSRVILQWRGYNAFSFSSSSTRAHGAEVGAFMYTTTPYFYSTSYSTNGKKTRISFFQYENNRVTVDKSRTQTYQDEYGSFFTIPVQLGNGRYIEALGFLNRKSDESLEIKYAQVDFTATGEDFLTERGTVSIETVVTVDAGFTAGFTKLYDTTNRIAFAALENRLFIGQKTVVEHLLLTHVDSPQEITVSSISPLLLIRSRKVTAISVLKESANKFYLAVGEPTVNKNAGRAVVFEGTDSAFSDITKKFTKLGDNEGDWFGWSVKLHLLDKTGDGTLVPVLFVGAPKATRESGIVKVFAVVDGAEIQKIMPQNSSVLAFGYSIAATGDHLAIGAPQSDSGKGAIHFYKWDTSEYTFQNAFAFSTRLHRVHGAEVGAYLYNNTPYFYSTSYSTDGESTIIRFFQYKNNVYTNVWTRTYQGEYGSFLNIPVKTKTSEEILGVLKREPDGSLKSKYAPFYGTETQDFTTFREIPINRKAETSFQTLYTTNKPSFAVLPDQLFIAQEESVYRTPLALITLVLKRRGALEVESLGFSIGALAKQNVDIEPTIGEKTITSTQGLSFSVLKVTDELFYLAIGDPSRKGKVVVFEGVYADFSSSQQKFQLEGEIPGSWYGWSVKLHLLDKDGAEGAGLPEPLLFVGIPKINKNTGLVKIFSIMPDNIRELHLLKSPTVNSPTEISVEAFGYSIGVLGEYLAIGAPQTNEEKGAIFFYTWNVENQRYQLKEAAFVGVAPTITDVVVHEMAGTITHSGDSLAPMHFGAEVGDFSYKSMIPTGTPDYHLNNDHFYSVGYNANHTKTILYLFHKQDDGTFTQVSSKDPSTTDPPAPQVFDEELGSFFTFHVGSIWEVWTSQRGQPISRRLSETLLPRGGGTFFSTLQLRSLGALTSDGAVKYYLSLFYPRTSGTIKFALPSKDDFKSILLEEVRSATPENASFVPSRWSLPLYGILPGRHFTSLYHPARVDLNVLEGEYIEEHVFFAGLQTFRLQKKGDIVLENAIATVDLFVKSDPSSVSLPFAYEKVETEDFQSLSALEVRDDLFYLAMGYPSVVTVFRAIQADFSDGTLDFQLEVKEELENNLGTESWFGWSVKLHLLDKDGAGTGNPAEPVLFVGAPQWGVGIVKVFTVAPTDASRDLQTLSPPMDIPDVVPQAFGYSIGAMENNVMVGAPKTNEDKGAVFFYTWNVENQRYQLKEAAFVGVAPTIDGVVVHEMAGTIAHSGATLIPAQFGAEIGAFIYDSMINPVYHPDVVSGHADDRWIASKSSKRNGYLYVVGYHANHTKTILYLFNKPANGTFTQVSSKDPSDPPVPQVFDKELGSFFTFYVQTVWEVYLSAGANTRWYYFTEAQARARAEEEKSQHPIFSAFHLYSLGALNSEGEMEYYTLPLDPKVGADEQITFSVEGGASYTRSVVVTSPNNMAFTKRGAVSLKSILSVNDKAFTSLYYSSRVVLDVLRSSFGENFFMTSTLRKFSLQQDEFEIDNPAAADGVITTLTYLLGRETPLAVSPPVKELIVPFQKLSLLKVDDDLFYLAVGIPGEVTVYQSSMPDFGESSEKFRIQDKRDDWFGWSVKLHLLDRDGEGDSFELEPLLLVGSPQWITGIVKLFVFTPTGGREFHTILPPSIDMPVVRSFGYSIGALGGNLAIGAPKTNKDKGAVFLYTWNVDYQEYQLKEAIFVGANPEIDDVIVYSMAETITHSGASLAPMHFGAEVGAFTYKSFINPTYYPLLTGEQSLSPDYAGMTDSGHSLNANYFYSVGYNEARDKTILYLFAIQHDGTFVQVSAEEPSDPPAPPAPQVFNEELGSFFTFYTYTIWEEVALKDLKELTTVGSSGFEVDK